MKKPPVRGAVLLTAPHHQAGGGAGLSLHNQSQDSALDGRRLRQNRPVLRRRSPGAANQHLAAQRNKAIKITRQFIVEGK